MKPSEKIIESIVAELHPEARILFITGAGLSADSGLPTYRGIGGLYEREMTEEGIPIEEAISGAMFRKRPELCWKYFAEVGQAALGSKPNRGHQVIAEMEAHFEKVVILTQNIDGYHRQAGSKNVIDIHGDMYRLVCPSCAYTRAVDNFEEMEIPPRCPPCGSVLRPDVILFGEMLDTEKLARLNSELETGFDFVFSVGTSSLFPYIAFPVVQASQLGWTTIEINPSVTQVSHLVNYRLESGAAKTLDRIWEMYQTRC